MTKAQVSIIVLSVAVLAGMVLLPPWMHLTEDGARQSMGYGPIWHPPVVSQEQGINLFGLKLEVEEQVRATRIDWERLVLQGMMVLVAGGAAYFIAGNSLRGASREAG